MVGYRLELGGREAIDIKSIELEDQLKHSPYYKDFFSDKEHYTYLGGTSQNPVIVSALQEDKVKGGHKWRVLARTKKDDYYFTIEAASKKKMLKYLYGFATDVLGPDLELYELPDPKTAQSLKQDLVHMEDRILIKAYKFGVVYCKKGQTDECDMFSNDKPSKRFNEFMDMMGTKTRLKGYKGYKGGLDTEHDTTGTHAYVTEFKGFEIVYHCSTLLPLTMENGTQQVARKRHIGNDVVVIIFQDGPTGGFSPATITSKFNHVYLVVQFIGRRKNTNGQNIPQYQIALVSKPGVKKHGPPLPPPGTIFSCDDDTREFILTKLINAERAAYYAPGFAQARTRRLWLKELLDKYGKPPKK
eukprot:TRINITY_DN671_c0_g2_i2.p1 TRINITY_DN671_c0_g2~~TRINITY_DN671_c0_g2_i2.p1  ORF type:complete len:358 (+),score=67.09 TRINITY_DN671_c0_g2_i2:696-1769(+)